MALLLYWIIDIIGTLQHNARGYLEKAFSEQEKAFLEHDEALLKSEAQKKDLKKQLEESEAQNNELKKKLEQSVAQNKMLAQRERQLQQGVYILVLLYLI